MFDIRCTEKFRYVNFLPIYKELHYILGKVTQNKWFLSAAPREVNISVFHGYRAFTIGLGLESRARVSGPGSGLEIQIPGLGLGPGLSGSGIGLGLRNLDSPKILFFVLLK